MTATTHEIHGLNIDEVVESLQTRREGLSEAEATARLRDHGPNRLESPSRFRWAESLMRQFLNFFSLLLDVAAMACFYAERVQPGEGMAVLGWALLVVSVVNALFAFAQEMRAERAMEELRKFLPQFVRVRRGGIERRVPAEVIVAGDVILLAEGDRIPADARVLQSEELLVNNAPLTGEFRSRPLVSRAFHGRLTDSRNIAFAGCSVLRGNGEAVVFATGHGTEFGKIAALSRDVTRPPSPIDRETSRMIRVLTIVAVVMGFLFFGWGVATGRSLWVNIVFMLGIIVANVPEGLLPTFTLALSMASLRMARRQVLVRSLEAVETLGAVHVVCTDKTGTLTKNELAIAAMIDPVSGEAFGLPQDARSFLKAALIASEVREESQWHSPSLRVRRPDHRRLTGDPLDVAVAERYRDQFGDPGTILEETRRHFPFDLAKRREAGVYVNRSEILFAVKGAWESLRPLIGFVFHPGEDPKRPVSESELIRCDEIVRRHSSEGKRVIAVASRRLPEPPRPKAEEESLEQALELRGFLVLSDPLRDEVPDAVIRCRDAGVQVVLVTGDHPETAEAIARQCGILSGSDAAASAILTGTDLDSLDTSGLAERLSSGTRVFARTTPEQKMKIVAALKHSGLIVAMTGDGVNDAPALRAADVGVAMGASGTDVAREAADIILLDDNFASLVAGIEEGRAVFANIRRFTTYVLASNIPEIVPFLLFVVLPVPLALTVIQILCIDLGTDLLPAIGLGQEPPEPDAMSRPPRKANAPLLSFRLMATAYLFLGVIQAAWSLFLFFLVLSWGGWQWGQELTSHDALYRSATGITLAAVVLMQIPNVIGRRSRRGSGLDRGLLRNPLILAGIGTEILFSWAILYVPVVSQFLGTGPVAFSVYALAWLGIPLLFLLDLGRKKLLAHAVDG